VSRRSVVALALAAVLVTSGCAGFSSSPRTTTPPDTIVVAGSGDYPHEIRVSNARDEAITLTVLVERDETLYRADHTVAANSDSVVAGFSVESLPENSRLVTVTARDERDNSTSVEVSISGCLGDVVIIVGQDGTLDSTYSIC